MTDYKNEGQGQNESTFDFIIRRAAELNKEPEGYVTKAQYKKEKEEWEENRLVWMEQEKKQYEKQDPILTYCDQIRGLEPSYLQYRLSYEDKLKQEEQDLQAQRDADERELAERRRRRRLTDIKLSTKQERKEYRIEKKQQEKDWELERKASPIRLLQDRLQEMDMACVCECEGLRIRVAGEYCKVCRLLVKVNDYMTNLCRDAAQGRTSL